MVDASGTTLGAATLEDVIEELVGEIRDSAHLEWPTPRNSRADDGAGDGVAAKRDERASHVTCFLRTDQMKPSYQKCSSETVLVRARTPDFNHGDVAQKSPAATNQKPYVTPAMTRAAAAMARAKGNAPVPRSLPRLSRSLHHTIAKYCTA